MSSKGWKLADLPVPEKDAPTCFSTFSCGGGSTMGYKLAGYRMLGNVEIDPTINAMYKKNHHPQHNYEMDLRDFNRMEGLPDELYDLDVLDGSPPCSTFSMAGSREQAWNVQKQFREGQAYQTLDDLFFVFIDTVRKLRPKVAVAENVKGLIAGNAKGYVNQIVKEFRDIGYAVQIFLLNAADYKVPQARERVFVIANRMGYPKLKIPAPSEPIKFGEVCSEEGGEAPTEMIGRLRQYVLPEDRGLGDIMQRVVGKNTYFNYRLVEKGWICPTITASTRPIRKWDWTYFTDEDIVACSTFPEDYDFNKQDPNYVCGMSVPPKMMQAIATAIKVQWLDKEIKSGKVVS